MNHRYGLAAALLLAVVAVSLMAAPPSTSSGATELPRPAVETPAPPSPWTTEFGGFSHLARIDVVSSDSVWGAGSHAVHFDGHAWRAVDSRDYPAELKGVDVLADGTGWIVGDEEEAIPVQGGQALPSTHIPGYRFRDVATISADEAWAVARPSRGGPSVILRYRDAAWHRAWTAPDSQVLLSAIWMMSADEGWAVGSTAVHYDGNAWTEWPLPVDASMTEVQGTAPDDVWAAGGTFVPPVFPENLDRRVIHHFDGTGWSMVLDEPRPGIKGLAVRDDEGYAVSAIGEVLALRDGRWVELDSLVPAGWEPPHLVSDVDFIPDSPDALVATTHGWIYSLEGDRVSLVRDAAAFHSVAMVSDALGWVLGRRAMVRDGSDWHEMPDDSELHRASDIAFRPGAGAWAVGPDGMILHHSNGEFVREASPSAADLVRIVIPNSNEIWILGEREIADEQAESFVTVGDGMGEWLDAWSGPGRAHDLTVDGEMALVATSEGVWRYATGSWSQVRDEPVVSVGIGPAKQLWVGTEGGIEAFDGGVWTREVHLPARARVHAFSRAHDAVWAVADLGYVLANTGDSWRIVRGHPDYSGHAGQRFGLQDLAVAPRSDGHIGLWAVGEPDTILQAAESDAIAASGVTLPPTSEPMPTISFEIPRAYLPLVLNRPAYRTKSCRGAPSATVTEIRDVARRTGGYYTISDSAPDPELNALHMLTLSELAEAHGIELAGARIGNRTVADDECVWRADLDGWFNSEASRHATAAPGGSVALWRRLELVLFAEDGLVIFEGFSSRTREAPPTPAGATPTPTAALPRPTAP